MTTETVQTANLPIKVEEFTSIIQSAPGMLSKNQSSVARCNDAGKTLLDTIEANGEINDDELDAKVADFISKTKITLNNMNKRRSPLTQLLTRIAKEFTTLENDINPTNKDAVAYKLQSFRDKYAAKFQSTHPMRGVTSSLILISMLRKKLSSMRPKKSRKRRAGKRKSLQLKL